MCTFVTPVPSVGCITLLGANATEDVAMCYRPYLFGRFLTRGKAAVKVERVVVDGSLWEEYQQERAAVRSYGVGVLLAVHAWHGHGAFADVQSGEAHFAFSAVCSLFHRRGAG